jgi:hypothetical protein
MQFSAATISAILAFTSFASAAPSKRGGYPQELSLTAQLQLADT